MPAAKLAFWHRCFVDLAYFLNFVTYFFTEGMNEYKRKVKGREKFQKCVETVDRHLEQSYRIYIPTSEDNLAKNVNLGKFK